MSRKFHHITSILHFTNLELTNRIQEEKQIESHQLLGVVDSLELLSKSTSRAVSKKSSTVTAVIEKSSALLESTINLKSINVLNDEKTNEITDIKRYVKMTDDDWNYLENIERIKQDGKPSRESTVHFNENEPVKGCHRLSGMSSILKRSSIESQNQFDVKQNALHLIQEKCRKSCKSELFYFNISEDGMNLTFP